MTVALIAAGLTAQARTRLEDEFDWELFDVPDIRSAIPLDDGPVDAERIEAIVIEAQPFPAELFAKVPRLRLLGCLRGEPVNVDLEAATRAGVPVLHTPGRNREAVADFVLGLILSTTRNIAATHHLIVSRQLTASPESVAARGPRKDIIWRPEDPREPIPYDVYRGRELGSLQLGLVGFGAIGRRVAEKARALSMAVAVHDPWVSAEEITRAGAHPLSLDDLLAACDVISLHARSSGPPIIGARQLSQMRPGSYLINTGRATLVDYDALADALRARHLAGAGLDVFPDEPLSAASPLLELDNVTLTPHLAGASHNVVEHQSAIFVESLAALAGGTEDMRRRAVRNPEVLVAG